MATVKFPDFQSKCTMRLTICLEYVNYYTAVYNSTYNNSTRRTAPLPNTATYRDRWPY